MSISTLSLKAAKEILEEANINVEEFQQKLIGVPYGRQRNLLNAQLKNRLSLANRLTEFINSKTRK